MNDDDKIPDRKDDEFTADDFSARMLSHSSHLKNAIADKLHGLTTAAAFAMLWYLHDDSKIQFYSKTHEGLGALEIAWWAAYLSCLFGAVNLWLVMYLPFRSYQVAERGIRGYRSSGEKIARPKAVSRSMHINWWAFPAYFHLLFLVAAFVLLGYYRFANLWTN